VTVLDSWSAVYTRSLLEIGWAPGSAGACCGCPPGDGCPEMTDHDQAPLSGGDTAKPAAAVMEVTTVTPLSARWRRSKKEHIETPGELDIVRQRGGRPAQIGTFRASSRYGADR
jgi:hypothetical protein